MAGPTMTGWAPSSTVRTVHGTARLRLLVANSMAFAKSSGVDNHCFQWALSTLLIASRAIRLDPGGALPIQLPIQCGARARSAVREQSDLTQPRTARGARAQCGVRAAGEVPMLPSGMYISDLNIDYVSEFRVRVCAKIRSVGIF
eukprot:SAG31_NODE_4292_length_3375_cov_9.381868_1_plen_145_part_00